MPNKILNEISDNMDRKELIQGIGEDVVDLLSPAINEMLESNKKANMAILEAVRDLKIENKVEVPKAEIDVKIPEIKVPDVKVNVPPVKIPKIDAPNVNVNVPDVIVPKITIPDIKMPSEMGVKGSVNLNGVDLDNPLPVQLRDAKGKPFKLNLGGGGASGGSNTKFIKGKSGNTVEVDDMGQLHVVAEGNVSTENSTNTTLGADETFTGDKILTLPYAVIVISVFSDVASATDGLKIEQSCDGTNWDHEDVFTIPAETGKTFSFQPTCQYLRVRYVNGSSAQGEFRLQTTLKKTYVKPSSHRVKDSVVGEDDAELVKSVVTGEDRLGTFQNVRVTDEGIMLVSNYLLEVSKGNITGQNIMNKFGENPEITTGTDPEDIWDGGGIYAFYPSTAQDMEIVSSDVDDAGTVVSSGECTGGSFTTLIDTGATFQTDGVAALDLVINDTTGQFGIVESVDSETQITCTQMTNGSQEDFQTSANSAGDAYRIANASGTGAATIQIFGLDSDWASQTETVVLNGTTVVDLAKTYIRINRMVVLTAGSSGGAEGTLTCRIDGAGTTAAVINNGNNQTLMAIYTIPAGRTGYFMQGYVGLSKGGGATAVNAQFSWRSRTFGGVFNVKGVINCQSSGSSYFSYNYAGAPGLPPRTDVLMRVNEVSATIGASAGFDLLIIDN